MIARSLVTVSAALSLMSFFAPAHAQGVPNGKLYICEIMDMAYVGDDGKLVPNSDDPLVWGKATFAFDVSQGTFRWTDGDSTPELFKVFAPNSQDTRVIAVKIDPPRGALVSALEIDGGSATSISPPRWPFRWFSLGELYSGLCRIF